METEKEGVDAYDAYNVNGKLDGLDKKGDDRAIVDATIDGDAELFQHTEDSEEQNRLFNLFSNLLSRHRRRSPPNGPPSPCFMDTMQTENGESTADPDVVQPFREAACLKQDWLHDMVCETDALYNDAHGMTEEENMYGSGPEGLPGFLVSESFSEDETESMHGGLNDLATDDFCSIPQDTEENDGGEGHCPSLSSNDGGEGHCPSLSSSVSLTPSRAETTLSAASSSLSRPSPVSALSSASSSPLIQEASSASVCSPCRALRPAPLPPPLAPPQLASRRSGFFSLLKQFFRFRKSTTFSKPKAHQALGVLITVIDPGSFSARAGLELGDYITHVNGYSVTSIQDVAKYMPLCRDGPVLHILRGESILKLHIDTAAATA